MTSEHLEPGPFRLEFGDLGWRSLFCSECRAPLRPTQDFIELEDADGKFFRYECMRGCGSIYGGVLKNRQIRSFSTELPV